MTYYTFHLIGFDGYLLGSISLAYASDEDALSKATEIVQTFYARVEVWDGSRSVGHRDATPSP